MYLTDVLNMCCIATLEWTLDEEVEAVQPGAGTEHTRKWLRPVTQAGWKTRGKFAPIDFQHYFNAAWLTIIKCSLQLSIYWWLT